MHRRAGWLAHLGVSKHSRTGLVVGNLVWKPALVLGVGVHRNSFFITYESINSLQVSVNIFEVNI